jgi:integrase
MSATKDSNGTWISRFYYDDHEGTRKQKFKRGFKTKKEALEYEREFLAKAEYKISMTFESLVEIYLNDISHRLRETTIALRKSIIKEHLMPYFKNKPVSEITPIVVRKFQNELISKNYTATYLKLINTTLSSIFNYAVSFCNLKQNPVRIAGSIGKKAAPEMQIWTLEEFQKVIAKAERIDMFTILNVLYWTGIRLGELLALTLEDIDLEKGTININKSYSRVEKKDIIGSTKTASSKRVVTITTHLVNVLKDYISKLYEPEPTGRLFILDPALIRREMKKIAVAAGVKIIRVHDLRHSHASLLIHLNVNPLFISKRLGHEKVDTTLNIYAHLYPDSSEKIIELLNKL